MASEYPKPENKSDWYDHPVVNNLVKTGPSYAPSVVSEFVNHLDANKHLGDYLHHRYLQGDLPKFHHIDNLVNLAYTGRDNKLHRDLLQPHIPIDTALSKASKYLGNKVAYNYVFGVMNHAPVKSVDGDWYWAPTTKPADPQEAVKNSSILYKDLNLTPQELRDAGIDTTELSLIKAGNSGDITAHHALADHLEEQGKTEEAAKIRKSLGLDYCAEMQDSWYVAYYSR